MILVLNFVCIPFKKTHLHSYKYVNMCNHNHMNTLMQPFIVDFVLHLNLLTLAHLLIYYPVNPFKYYYVWVADMCKSCHITVLQFNALFLYGYHQFIPFFYTGFATLLKDLLCVCIQTFSVMPHATTFTLLYYFLSFALKFKLLYN